MKNLFADLPTTLPDELTDRLVDVASVRIERIVSQGQSSPNDFWYDQEEIEWVIVLRGAARLQFAGDDVVLEMKAGDFVEIPAHRRHRVQWTSPNEVTVWLAVFYRE
jgi:cupin 2 domain-containing protein